VRQDEREACAKICEEASIYFDEDIASLAYAANHCSYKILERGEK
jgi:hypothetical protein